MEHYSTLAFVLKQEPIKEQDRNYTFYTQKFGKLAILAPGARKIKAKLSGHLELPSLVQIEFAMSYKPRLISALEKFSFPEIKKKKKPLTAAFLMADLTDKLSLEKQDDPEIWKLLFNSFYFLEENLNKSPQVVDFIWLYFNAQFLEILGLSPFLEGCTECGRTINNKFFSFEKKGVVCQQHSHKDDWPISNNQKRALNKLFNFSLKQFSDPSCLKEVLEEKKYIEKFLSKFTLVIKSDIINL
ncbi:MAG: DNA repair protein RecO [Candidatus Pacebacteria bacterium]|jgi:DNA repair protein RecO (recombination protein O)|nr:DNA repair protein RecO [Candidatus Paceibacterota bacterium]